MGLDMYNLIYPSPMGSPRPITDFALFCMVGYLPLSDRSAPVYATFIEGYALCFKIVGIILARKEVPTVQKMMEEMQTSCGGQIEFLEGRSILTFLEKGGCAEYVLNAVIHRSWEEVNNICAETTLAWCCLLDFLTFVSLYHRARAAMPPSMNSSRTTLNF